MATLQENDTVVIAIISVLEMESGLQWGHNFKVSLWL